MYTDYNSVHECDGCGESGLTVRRTTIDDKTLYLCPQCNDERTLGGEPA